MMLLEPSQFQWQFSQRACWDPEASWKHHCLPLAWGFCPSQICRLVCFSKSDMLPVAQASMVRRGLSISQVFATKKN